MRNSGKLKKALALLLFIALFALVGLAVMYLWNLLIPSVIGWSAINYWQAVGFMVLTRLLFGGRGMFRHFKHHPSAFNNNREGHEQMRNMSWFERREHIRRHMAEFRNERENRQTPSSGNNF